MQRFMCAALLAVGRSSAIAVAADMKPIAKAPDKVAANPGIAFGSAVMSDYNLRGATQSSHEPSAAAYFEPRCSLTDSLRARLGVAGESIAFRNPAAAEIDFYGGIRPTFDKLTLDFDGWRYYYPGGQCFNDLAVGGPN
jgi:Bacterial protein of unknown function (Gcw_chp)